MNSASIATFKHHINCVYVLNTEVTKKKKKNKKQKTLRAFSSKGVSNAEATTQLNGFQANSSLKVNGDIKVILVLFLSLVPSHK